MLLCKATSGRAKHPLVCKLCHTNPRAMYSMPTNRLTTRPTAALMPLNARQYSTFLLNFSAFLIKNKPRNPKAPPKPPPIAPPTKKKRIKAGMMANTMSYHFAAGDMRMCLAPIVRACPLKIVPLTTMATGSPLSGSV